MSGTTALTLRYILDFENGSRKEFEARFDAATMSLIPAQRAGFPSWTALSCCRCPNCPLDEREHLHCPTAVALIDIVEHFRDSISHEKVRVTVETQNRTFRKDTTLHMALSSLIGIYMATGGCPVMERLRPMARFHLPFADEDETMFRSLSAYLLGQYFIMTNGGNPDWEMKSLVGMYDRIRAVNKSFCDRLRTVSTRDSSVNALIGLDCFADIVIFSINQRFMEDLETLYQAYLK